MAFRSAQANFSKGEVSPEIYGRFDVAAYNAGVKRARNVIVMKYGGLTKRPGTRLVAEVYNAADPVRLIPFQFSLDQAYALELGQGYMRPAADGGMVLEEELLIMGATNANPIQITAANHAYEAGDQVFLSGVGGMIELNGKIVRVLASIDDDNFTIDLNGTGFGVFTLATGGITRADPPDVIVPPTVPPIVAPPPPPTTGSGGGYERRYDGSNYN